MEKIGKQYVLTAYGILDDGKLYTKEIKDRKDIPLSYADHVTMKNCKCECETYFNVEPNKAQYELSDFTFENLDIWAKNDGFKADAVENMKIINVNIVTQV